MERIAPTRAECAARNAPNSARRATSALKIASHRTGSAPSSFSIPQNLKFSILVSPNPSIAYQDYHKTQHTRPPYLLHIHLCPNEITSPPITRTLSVPATTTFATLHHALQIAFGWAGTHAYDFAIHDPTYVKPPFNLSSHIALRAAQDAHARGGPPPPPEPREFLLRIASPPPTEPVLRRLQVDRVHEKNDRQNPLTPEKLSTKVKLQTILEDPAYAGKKPEYCYDFGDWWYHFITVVPQTTPSTISPNRIICTSGTGHPCAEDVGHVNGWKKLKEAYRATRPTAEQKQQMVWYEGMCPNGDAGGLKGGKVGEWDVEGVNARLAELKI